MAVEIFAQNGDHRFLIDAGGDGDTRQARIYDLLLDTLSDPILEATIRAQDPGWVEPFAIPSVLDFASQRAATALRTARPPD